ncbi:MAG: hypothetical protein E7511_03205 [Ruminococcus sp.]|nr:hypothetical protein [Ruminococcus sp.]
MPRKTNQTPRTITVEAAGQDPQTSQMRALTREMVKAMRKFFADPVIAADFERWRQEQREEATP